MENETETPKELFDKLEPDAQEVVTEFMRRLLVGQEEYGRLNIATDDRNWQQEILEENLDSAFYQITNLIKIQRNR